MDPLNVLWIILCFLSLDDVICHPFDDCSDFGDFSNGVKQFFHAALDDESFLHSGCVPYCVSHVDRLVDNIFSRTRVRPLIDSLLNDYEVLFNNKDGQCPIGDGLDDACKIWYKKIACSRPVESQSLFSDWFGGFGNILPIEQRMRESLKKIDQSIKRSVFKPEIAGSQFERMEIDEIFAERHVPDSSLTSATANNGWERLRQHLSPSLNKINRTSVKSTSPVTGNNIPTLVNIVDILLSPGKKTKKSAAPMSIKVVGNSIFYDNVNDGPPKTTDESSQTSFETRLNDSDYRSGLNRYRYNKTRRPYKSHDPFSRQDTIDETPFDEILRKIYPSLRSTGTRPTEEVPANDNSIDKDERTIRHPPRSDKGDNDVTFDGHSAEIRINKPPFVKVDERKSDFPLPFGSERDGFPIDKHPAEKLATRSPPTNPSQGSSFRQSTPNGYGGKVDDLEVPQNVLTPFRPIFLNDEMIRKFYEENYRKRAQ